MNTADQPILVILAGTWFAARADARHCFHDSGKARLRISAASVSTRIQFHAHA